MEYKKVLIKKYVLKARKKCIFYWYGIVLVLIQPVVDDEQLRQKLCLFFPIDICHIYQYMCIVGQRYFSLNLPIQMKRINWCGGHTVQFSNGLFSFCLCFPTKPEISAAIGLEIYSEMTSCDCISVIVILNYVYKNKECLKILA